MPTSRAAQGCASRNLTEALAAGRLGAAERTDAERHLEDCEACRGVFRHLTAERFPRVRNYTVLSELGRGGFGIVYKAFHNGKARVEALKVLFGKTPLRTAYFENEVHLVARLRHPNIATLYEAHLSPPPLFYTMEFVAGEELDDYLRSRAVSLEERIGLIRTVAEAVHYAHSQGVVHRDLKPQNILIDATGQPRIVDFGIARKLALADTAPAENESPRTGEGPMGTVGYIAPEQMAGQRVDARADVYGLGVLLFHVITGLPARLAVEPGRLARLLRARKVSRAGDLAAIIGCCLDPLPELRYATCAALVEDLDSYLAGHEIRARRGASPGYHVARMAALVVRNHPWPVKAVTTLAVAAVLTGIFWKAWAHWLVPGRPAGQTTLITLTGDTVALMKDGRLGADLPGFDPANPKSWRVLYGRLLEHLEAAEPRAVVFDVHFPDPQPDFDPAFVRGIARVGAPVVVGAAGLDINSEPELCPEIAAAAHGWGLLHVTRPEYFRDEITMPMALLRGLNPPAPSLALAAFAAARHADCDVEYLVRPTQIDLRYRRRQVARGQERYLRSVDRVPVFEVGPAREGATLLGREDRPVHGRFRLTDVPAWTARAIPLEQVLAADADQLRAWFGHRVVLIGHRRAGADEHVLKDGTIVHGCLVQAVVLDALLGGPRVQRFERTWLVARVCGWSVIGALLASLVAARNRATARVWTLACLGALVAGLVLATGAATRLTQPWLLDGAIAASALLSVGGLVALLTDLHRRQLRLAPASTWAAGPAGTSTTILATPRESSSDKS